MRKIVLGLGTGRSGTGSLVKLLGQQDGFSSTYEAGQSAGWEFNERKACKEILRMLMREELYVADAGWYWLMHVPSLIAFVPSIKFVCLQRDRESLLESFRKTSYAERFLIKQGSEHYCLERALPTTPFPRYDLSPEEAGKKYYDFYCDSAKNYEESYPWNFGLFDLECLNSFEGQRKILDFLEIPRGRHVITPGIKAHASDILSIHFNELNCNEFKCSLCGGVATFQIVAKMQEYQNMLCDDCKWKGIEKAVNDTGKNGFTLIGGDNG